MSTYSLALRNDAFTTIDTLESATEPSTREGGALNQSAYWVPSIFTEDGTRLEYIEPLLLQKWIPCTR